MPHARGPEVARATIAIFVQLSMTPHKAAGLAAYLGNRALFASVVDAGDPWAGDAGEAFSRCLVSEGYLNQRFGELYAVIRIAALAMCLKPGVDSLCRYHDLEAPSGPHRLPATPQWAGVAHAYGRFGGGYLEGRRVLRTGACDTIESSRELLNQVDHEITTRHANDPEALDSDWYLYTELNECLLG